MIKRQFTLQQLADRIGATIVGDGAAVVSGIATLPSATNEQISFLANPVYQKYLSSTNAAAVILSQAAADQCPVAALVHEKPYLAYAHLSHLWDEDGQTSDPVAHVHERAIVHDTAEFGDNVVIDAGAVIQAGVVLGSDVVIGANCVIGRDSRIGSGTRLHAGVTIYHGVEIGKDCLIHSGVVIGSDGFGFAPDRGQWHKIAQLGGVVIGDRVEIGANSAIDRGALDNTVIENGVKLDNQIQIAHNVRVGENTAIAACSAIAGSTTIGKNCVFGGASGVAGHLTIVDNVHLTAMTMVIKSLTEPGIYSSGTGVQPNAKWRKSIARLRQLDQMAQRLKTLEKTIFGKTVLEKDPKENP